MLQLRVYATAPQMAEAAERLRALPGARHVRFATEGNGDAALLEADLRNDAADPAVEIVRRLGVPVQDIALLRLDDIGPASAAAQPAAVVWTDLLAQAGVNTRPVARYLVLMGCAGVIAAFGVIDKNQILIVGAMAISPDMLPITAACIGLVGRRPSFVARGLVTLFVGLGMAALTAAVVTGALNLFSLFPQGFPSDLALVTGQDRVDSETILVALAAGVAGMLALETRASAAVGVAISVTTIPAAAYLGVAWGAGTLAGEGTAWAVLFTNVLLILVGGTTTLWLQQVSRRRREARAP